MMATMNVSSSTRSIPYGAPYAYEKLVEKNDSIQESSISLDGGGSLSTILLSFDNNRSVSSSSDVGSYSYSVSDSGDSVDSDDSGRLGATPSKMRGQFPSKKREGFPSLSPVKRSEKNDTLDIPGLSDWSVDISRMSMPAMMTERNNDDEAIAQDANTPTREEADVASLEDESSPRNNDAEIPISLREQLESLGLRLESLEKAIFSDSDDLNRTSDVGDQTHNMAFIIEEEDSTVESLTDEITLLEDFDNGNARKTRRSKTSLFVRFLFFGGCRKL